MEHQKDIFLCHASEDKDEIVRPLARALADARISFWLDEAEIKWGDSITAKVNEGLRNSLYVIVVLSNAFLSKNWPEREMNSAISVEASSGEVRVLPLMAGSAATKDRILDQYPILHDKFYMTWSKSVDVIVDALRSRLDITEIVSKDRYRTLNENDDEIPLPKIKRTFTQRDKDFFLKEAFEKIKSYFVKALSRLEANNSDVETDFTEINPFKFICTIYLRGNIANKCKVWGSGPIPFDSIKYQEGDVEVDDHSTFNDLITVIDEGPELGLKPSLMLWSDPSIDAIVKSQFAEIDHSARFKQQC